MRIRRTDLALEAGGERIRPEVCRLQSGIERTTVKIEDRESHLHPAAENRRHGLKAACRTGMARAPVRCRRERPALATVAHPTLRGPEPKARLRKAEWNRV